MAIEQAKSYPKAKKAVFTFQAVRNGTTSLPQPPGKQTKWVWFSQKELLRIIKILDEKFVGHKLEERGIKCYLGMYPTDEDSGHVDPLNTYKDRLCLVLAPSRIIKKADGTEVIMDYGKDDSGKVFPDIDTHLAFGESPYDNIGTMCPPRCQNNEGDVF